MNGRHRSQKERCTEAQSPRKHTAGVQDGHNSNAIVSFAAIRHRRRDRARQRTNKTNIMYYSIGNDIKLEFPQRNELCGWVTFDSRLGTKLTLVGFLVLRMAREAPATDADAAAMAALINKV